MTHDGTHSYLELTVEELEYLGMLFSEIRDSGDDFETDHQEQLHEGIETKLVRLAETGASHIPTDEEVREQLKADGLA